jgi:putative ABC transport system ATP-binding protein
LLQARSGKGKSTAIKLLTRKATNSSGKLTVEGPTLLLASTIGVVWQDLGLILSLTGKENILLKYDLLADPLVKLEDLNRWASILGIEGVWEKPVHQLSYGERQRIAILRALAGKFKWLLLDEPFSHLDQFHANKAAELIIEVCQLQGAGYLLTSLDETSILPFDKRILL